MMTATEIKIRQELSVNYIKYVKLLSDPRLEKYRAKLAREGKGPGFLTTEDAENLVKYQNLKETIERKASLVILGLENKKNFTIQDINNAVNRYSILSISEDEENALKSAADFLSEELALKQEEQEEQEEIVQANEQKYLKVLKEKDVPVMFKASLTLLGFDTNKPAVSPAELNEKMQTYRDFLAAADLSPENRLLQRAIFAAAQFLRENNNAAEYNAKHQAALDVLKINMSDAKRFSIVRNAAEAQRNILLGPDVYNARAELEKIADAEKFLTTDLESIMNQQYFTEKKLTALEKKVQVNAELVAQFSAVSPKNLQRLDTRIEAIQPVSSKNLDAVEGLLTKVQKYEKNIVAFRVDIDSTIPSKVTAITQDETHLLAQCAISVQPQIRARAQAVKKLDTEVRKNLVDKQAEFSHTLTQTHQKLEQKVVAYEKQWEDEAKAVVAEYKGKDIFKNKERQESADNFLHVLAAIEKAQQDGEIEPMDGVDILLEYIQREKNYVQQHHKWGGVLAFLGITKSRLHTIFEDQKVRLEKLKESLHIASKNHKAVAQPAVTSPVVKTSPKGFAEFVKDHQDLQKSLKHGSELGLEPAHPEIATPKLR